MTVLYFPQWQGAGKDDGLGKGSAHIRSWLLQSFPEMAPHFVQVPVVAIEDLEVENNIIGYRAILRQFQYARMILEKHNPDYISVLGGDCGVVVAPISFLSQKYQQNFAVVWLDAHGDLNTPATSPSHTFHGMPLRVLLGEGDPEIVKLSSTTLQPEQIFLVDVRDFDPPEKDFVEQNQIPNFSVTNSDLVGSQLVWAIQERGYSHIYVHLDVDVLDPDIFPHTGTPAPGGMAVESVVELLRIINDHLDVVGFSVTEYASETAQDIDVIAPILEYFIKPAQRVAFPAGEA